MARDQAQRDAIHARFPHSAERILRGDIWNGQTIGELRAAHGEPDAVETIKSTGQHVYKFRKGTPDVVLEVTLLDGRVVEWPEAGPG